MAEKKEKEISVDLDKYEEYFDEKLKALKKKTYKFGEYSLKFDGFFSPKRYLDYQILRGKILSYAKEIGIPELEALDSLILTEKFVNSFFKKCVFPDQDTDIEWSGEDINNLSEASSDFFSLYEMSTSGRNSFRNLQEMQNLINILPQNLQNLFIQT